jgi:hypothetical protein
MRGATIIYAKENAVKVTLTEPGIACSYVVAERRGHGALVLMPERERLSDVIAQTEGQVFEDEGTRRARSDHQGTSPRAARWTSSWVDRRALVATFAAWSGPASTNT